LHRRRPDVWLMLLNHMAQNALKLPHLKFVVCGGSAMPRSMIKAFVDMGIEVRHAWGMTEMSPLGTVGALKPPFVKLTGEEKLDVLQLQGYPPFGVQMKITDDDGKELPWDGKTFGQLKVAGPAVSKAYYRVDSKSSTTTASSTPATSPPSTSTAICISPTVPRT
jgi:fatty-acyl-CoA synthase